MIATAAIAKFGLLVVRPGVMVISTPVFGGAHIPAQVRIGLGLMLAIVIAPVVPTPQSVGTIAESYEFWGIDSGLLHLARIAGLRCVSFWGPTDPATRLRDTWGIEESIHYRKIACSPCVHTTQEPPCRGDNRCIQGLFDEGAAVSRGWTPVEYPRRRGR